VIDTSISTATTLLLTAAIGFLSVAWFGPEHERAEERRLAERPADDVPPHTKDNRDETVALDTMMGKN
jgi:hypothetical protein